MSFDHLLPCRHEARLARAGSKAGGSQRLTCRTARAVLWRRPADQAVLARQACSSYSPFLCLAAPGLSLHTQTQAWCWCLYAFLGRWAGGIAQKLIAMYEHWLPLEIANVSLSFLLQMLHVKNINWTLRFGAVASEPANLFNVALASGHISAKQPWT